MNKTLNPLMEFTDALSGEEYVSMSYVKPVLHLLNNTVLPLADDDTDLTNDMKRAILKYFNEKYSDPATDDLLDMASFVDPRFRVHHDKSSCRNSGTARDTSCACHRVTTITHKHRSCWRSPERTQEE